MGEQTLLQNNFFRKCKRKTATAVGKWFPPLSGQGTSTHSAFRKVVFDSENHNTVLDRPPYSPDLAHHADPPPLPCT